MTGSLSVRGDVLPVGGVTYKIEAAAQAGLKKVIIPKANEADVLIEKAYREKIQIIPVSSIAEVMEHSLVGPRKNPIIERLKNITKLSFEEAIKELTSIVGKIEQGDISLQDSLQQYERGMALIKQCRTILQQAEKRIEQISQEKEKEEKPE